VKRHEAIDEKYINFIELKLGYHNILSIFLSISGHISLYAAPYLIKICCAQTFLNLDVELRFQTKRRRANVI